MCLLHTVAPSSNTAPTAPTDLRVELLKNPYGIDTRNPAFSWILHDADTNDGQSAYRVVVSSTRSLSGDVLDTGFVPSAQNVAVHIDNVSARLAPYTLYYWQVQVKDTAGAVSPLSDAAVFMTGIEDNWSSLSGIWAAPDADGRANFAFFRSPILCVDTARVDKVIVSVAARGTAIDRGTIADIFVNDTCIGAGAARELANVGAFVNGNGYTKVYYNSYDITPLLENGCAVISAVANCRDENRGLLFQAVAFYTDGTKAILTNSGIADSGWKVQNGTAAFGDTGDLISTGYVRLFHENICAHAYPFGFTALDFDDTAWQPAVHSLAPVADAAVGTDGRVLYPFGSEPALRVAVCEPEKRVYRNPIGNVTVDLGKEIIGGMRVRIHAKAESAVTVRMGEELQKDGTVRYKLCAVPTYEDVWTLKAGDNTFDTVTMRNFRYVEFIGLDSATEEWMLAHPDCIGGWAIQQPFDETESDFHADDGTPAATLLNRLYALSKYTIKATNQDLFVDSQARERAGYEGDLLVNSNTSYAVSGNYSLARHSNEWLIDNPTWPIDYTLFSVEMAYLDYMYTGNTDSIAEFYTALIKKLVARVEYEDTATGLIRSTATPAGANALIDWPVGERDGYVASTYDVILNCEYVGIYGYMAVMADALGNHADAAHYRQKSATLKASLLSYAYNRDNGTFYDSLADDYTPTDHCSTHASAYALAYGVFDGQAMADALCRFVYDQCKEAFKGSVYVTYFILKGLYMGNHGDLAEKLLTNPIVGENVKTYASVLDDLHCTITPEAWGHRFKANMTLSHPWGASPGCSIVQGMFGIRPTTAGFAAFDIRLQYGEIRKASVKTPSPRGMIAVAYTVSDTGVTVTATVPVNTTATLYIPITESAVTVNDTAVDAVCDGIYTVVTLGAGTHTIHAQ